MRHRAATYHAVGRTNYWLTAPTGPTQYLPDPSAPSLGWRLEAAPATVTSAAAPAVAWSGSQPSGPRSPWSPVRQAPKSMASPVELAEMEGGKSPIGLLDY